MQPLLFLIGLHELWPEIFQLLQLFLHHAPVLTQQGQLCIHLVNVLLKAILNINMINPPPPSLCLIGLHELWSEIFQLLKLFLHHAPVLTQQGQLCVHLVNVLLKAILGQRQL